MAAVYLGNQANTLGASCLPLLNQLDFCTMLISVHNLLSCLLAGSHRLNLILCSNADKLINLQRNSLDWRTCSSQAAVCNLLDRLNSPCSCIRSMRGTINSAFFSDASAFGAAGSGATFGSLI